MEHLASDIPYNPQPLIPWLFILSKINQSRDIVFLIIQLHVLCMTVTHTILFSDTFLTKKKIYPN